MFAGMFAGVRRATCTLDLLAALPAPAREPPIIPVLTLTSGARMTKPPPPAALSTRREDDRF